MLCVKYSNSITDDRKTEWLQPMDTHAQDSPKREKLREIGYDFTPVLIDLLGHLRASLMVTTYQAGKLLVLGVRDGQLKITFSHYEQPMGLAISGDRLAIGTRRQMNFLSGNREVAPSVAPAGTWDVCYVPRTSTWTGSIHGHDLAWGSDGLWMVNTRFSCLCTLHEDYSFVPQWKPRFISQLIDQDRCHLNGLAMVDGRPRFVTAMAEVDTAGGWRPTKATSGVIIDVESGETIARGFAMPHSPRWHRGKLWVLDSGRGALGTVDPATGRFETVETFPGYTRGLSFLGQFAFVGLSRIRETSVFGGVPIAERRDELKCGVGVVDLDTGRTVAVFQFLSGVTEIFAVEVAAGAACPYVAGASSDGNEHDVWIVPQPGMVPAVKVRKPWFTTGGDSAVAGSSSSPATNAGSRGIPEDSGRQMSLEDLLVANPGDASGWVTLGNLRQEQNRQPEALECYERAVAADPTMPAARQNLGYLLFNQGFPERAAEVYRELLALDPSPINRLLSTSVLPVVYQSSEDLRRWRHEQQAALQSMVDDRVTVDASKQLVPTAFFWPYQGLNDCQVMKLRGQAIRGRASDANRPPAASADSGDSRLRVGFLSAYFRNHTIGRLNIGRIEKFDRSRFHVTVCSASTGTDEFSARFLSAADRFVRIPREVKAAIDTIEKLDLDVLVFADVGMDSLCSTLAFSRMAPVQCVTWGHPETSGSQMMDYFLSSELLDDEASQSHYTERLVRMPLTGTYYERPPVPSITQNVRSRLGLPEGGNLYACPQSLFKFHPDDDQVLRRILEADPNGTLVAIQGRVTEWTARLKSRWHITLPNVQDRITFLPALSHEDYLRLLHECDVMLDPLHFGGGNSSYEALAMGTPIVTLPSNFLRGRITAGLYRKMQMMDCVVDSADDYVSLAVKLAGNREFRRAISEKINGGASVLFEDMNEVRCLEDALLECVACGRLRLNVN
jgi:protein O-GlcNAc transferase